MRTFEVYHLHHLRVTSMQVQNFQLEHMVSEGTRGKYLIARTPQTPNLLHLVFCSQFLQGEIKEIISELRPSTEHFTLNRNLFEKLISS